MARPPSSALAGAAVSAGALARLVAGLAAGLALPAETALAVSRTCRAIERVGAPRVRSRADVGAIGRSLAGAVLQIARAAEPRDVAPLLYGAADGAAACVPVSASPVLTREYAFAGALAAGVRVACLGEAFLAEARSTFTDRAAAVQARARIAAGMDGASDAIATALGHAVLGVLDEAARACTTHLVQTAATLQPIVRVETRRSMPSTALAWGLYADPARAPELVARVSTGTPLFMPATFEAVSPQVRS